MFIIIIMDIRTVCSLFVDEFYGFVNARVDKCYTYRMASTELACDL